jgi:hypothetical protein
MASLMGCTKASDDLPFHYHGALIPYESARSLFSKPAVQQFAWNGFSRIGRSVVELVLV